MDSVPAGLSTGAGPSVDVAVLSFEDALRALEEVVRRLESGDVPLDDSISLYERGEVLRHHCQTRLDAAQARIERVVAGSDGAAAGTQRFDPLPSSDGAR